MKFINKTILNIIYNKPFHLKRKLNELFTKNYSTRVVLGIETSCDDTAAAVVDEHGNILGEEKYNQNHIHLQNGGILPPLAKNLHEKYIEKVVQAALTKSGYQLKDLSAIATTVKPGLALSLSVGMEYGKELVRQSGKPFIPIHHMEAHALTVRMVEKVEFPFLVLLVSGGHSQIVVAKNVSEFLLIGETTDNALGEVFDKVARRLKLRNIPKYNNVNGGRAIEDLAKDGNHLAFAYPFPMLKHADCNLSFAGLMFNAITYIQKAERELDIMGDELIPNLPDFCASFQYACIRHIIKKLIRAVEYVERKGLIPNDRKSLVVSGGVACNNYLKSALAEFCEHVEYKFFPNPAHLCMDNGVMIAWNGIEKLKAGVGIEDPSTVDLIAKCPIGTSLIGDLRKDNITNRQLGKVKLNLFKPKQELNVNSNKDSVESQ